MRTALVFLLLAAIVFILLATQDPNISVWLPLELPFTDLTVSSPLLGWIAGGFGLGLVLGYLAGLPGRVGAATRARKAEKRLEKAGVARAEIREEVADARAEAHEARVEAAEAKTDAAETERLAAEVARRTESVTTPPPSMPPPTTPPPATPPPPPEV